MDGLGVVTGLDKPVIKGFCGGNWRNSNMVWVLNKICLKWKGGDDWKGILRNNMPSLIAVWLKKKKYNCVCVFVKDVC